MPEEGVVVNQQGGAYGCALVAAAEGQKEGVLELLPAAPGVDINAAVLIAVNKGKYQVRQ